MIDVTQSVYTAAMAKPDPIRQEQAARLRMARDAAGYKRPTDALESVGRKYGWKSSTYMAHENGQNGIPPAKAVEYGDAYDVDPGWILTAKGRGPHEKSKANGEAVPQNFRYADKAPELPNPRDMIPVMGSGEGGRKGEMLFNGEPVDHRPRPASLANAARAYMVYVIGESMEPRYHPGELLHIHPGKPATIGSYVLVQLRPLTEGEPPRALIARLVRKSGHRVTLGKLNPKEELEFSDKEIVSIHLIVGTGE